MEQQFQITVPGTEVEVDDMNLVSANAARATDRALGELLRMGATDRGIVPGAGTVISGSGSANASVNLGYFRACFWPSGAGPNEIRTATYFLEGTLQLAAAANNRWDLIYARLDVDVPDSPVVRYVKANDDSISAMTLSKTNSVRVVVGVVQGVEATSPVRPALPADSGSSHYLVLGYVQLGAGHTLFTAIGPTQICEAFFALSIAAALGAPKMRPASINCQPERLSAEPPWTPGARPKAFIPPSVVGGESRVLAIHLGVGSDPRTLAAGDNIVDDSVDWRKRLFKITVSVGTTVADDYLPWVGGAGQDLPRRGDAVYIFMGNSYFNSALLTLDATSIPILIPTGSITLQVDASTGKLRMHVSGTPNIVALLWIEATGYHANAF